MNSPRHLAFSQEVAFALELMKRRKNDEAFRCLERAHVLGQEDVARHVLAHWLMLKLALVNRDAGAVFGQALRILLGTLGSALGVVPKGNTGGTNVGMFRRMPIPPELAKLMNADASRHPDLPSCRKSTSLSP